MTIEEFDRLKAEIRARGFTHVVTMAGPHPLDQWHPYGLLGGVNDRAGTSATGLAMELTWDGPDSVTDMPTDPARRAPPPFVHGVWYFTRDSWECLCCGSRNVARVGFQGGKLTYHCADCGADWRAPRERPEHPGYGALGLP